MLILAPCGTLRRPSNRPNEMADFIFQSNIAHYNELLATETDARKIATLRKLLAEEEAKYAEWRAKNPSPKKPE
jgi:hypothetical protein